MNKLILLLDQYNLLVKYFFLSFARWKELWIFIVAIVGIITLIWMLTFNNWGPAWLFLGMVIGVVGVAIMEVEMNPDEKP